MVVSVLIRFGIDWVLSRDVAAEQGRAKSYLGSALLVRLMLSIAFLLMIFAIVSVKESSPGVNQVVFLLAFAILFQIVAGTFTSLFEAYQLFGYRSFFNLFLYLLLLMTLLIVLEWQRSLQLVGISFLGVNFVYLITTAVLCFRKITGIRLQFDPKHARKLFLIALPLGISDLFLMIYYRIDAVLLSWFHEDRIVGWYDSIYNFVYALRLLPAALVIVFLPSLSSIFQDKREETISIYRKITVYSLSVGLLLTLLVAVAAEDLVRLVYGPGYVLASSVLPILIWTCPFIFVNAFQGMFLIVSERRKALLTAHFAGAVSNVCINLLLIPRWDMMGAAVATLISEFLVFLVCFKNLLDIYSMRQFLRDSSAPILATILAGTFSILYSHTSLAIRMLIVILSFGLPLLGFYRNKIFTRLKSKLLP
jgi:O-antigen/teichoic acid export membrane protein